MKYEELKRAALAIVTAMSLALPVRAQISWRIPTPWGDAKGSIDDPITAIVDPLSHVNPTGVPTPAALTNFIIKNPEALAQLASDPRQLAYIPVATAITAGRNAVLANGGRRIPDNIRAALSPWFSGELLNSIRWSTNWNALQNSPQAAQMWRDSDTRAITLINAIVFRTSKDSEDVSLWAHELVHAQQFVDWGVLGFAERWVNNSSVTGPVEQPAYDQQASIEKVLSSRGITTLPIFSGSDCRSVDKSTAVCDLWVAARDSRNSTFYVHGRAEAAGNGTRSGRMRLIMVANGKACNSDAGVVLPVDNSTVASGTGYSCQIDVAPGNSVRVTVVAPNSRADAVSTTAIANRY